MKITIPGVASELAAAIRRVNALRQSLPEDERPEFNEGAWQQLEVSLDRACATANREDALTAVLRWETTAISALEGKCE